MKPWYSSPAKNTITKKAILESLKNNFNCEAVVAADGQSIRVKHKFEENNPRDPSQEYIWLSITFSTEDIPCEGDSSEEFICSIWSMRDDSGDAHQHLYGAAVNANMIAAALYFAT